MKLVTLKPRVSEKSTALAERAQYCFDVPMAATKIEVASAVETQFKVNVLDVNMLIHKGKLKRFKRTLGRESNAKKAIVTLKKGQAIKLFEGAK